MNEIKRCVHCVKWAWHGSWQGQCSLHPWPRPRYAQDAAANGCLDYKDKLKTKEAQ